MFRGRQRRGRSAYQNTSINVPSHVENPRQYDWANRANNLRDPYLDAAVRQHSSRKRRIDRIRLTRTQTPMIEYAVDPRDGGALIGPTEMEVEPLDE